MSNSWSTQSKDKSFAKSVSKASNILQLLIDIFHFSNIARSYGWVLKPIRKLYLHVSELEEMSPILWNCQQRKFLKISVFSCTTFIGIQELCDVLFTCSFKISLFLFLINLSKTETVLVITFVSNCNNAWVVSIF